MRLRLVAGAALALGLLAVACGGGDSIPEDPRVKDIGFVAEEATYAYAGSGPAGLYPYLAPALRNRCTEEQFAQALAGQELPTGFRGLKSVRFEGDEARVTVILIVRDHDTDVEWVFVPDTDGPGQSWYLSRVPGIEGCPS